MLSIKKSFTVVELVLLSASEESFFYGIPLCKGSSLALRKTVSLDHDKGSLFIKIFQAVTHNFFVVNHTSAFDDFVFKIHLQFAVFINHYF